MSPAAFLDQVNGRGLSVADYRDSLAREILVAKVVEHREKATAGAQAETRNRGDELRAWVASLKAEYRARAELPASERRSLEEAARSPAR